MSDLERGIIVSLVEKNNDLNKTIKEQQEEINRLTIAYQNASDQRQHYIDKCLRLSEVFLESHELLDNHNNYAKDILELKGDNWTNIDAFFGKHKDLINELKRNLEVKSE